MSNSDDAVDMEWSRMEKDWNGDGMVAPKAIRHVDSATMQNLKHSWRAVMDDSQALEEAVAEAKRVEACLTIRRLAHNRRVRAAIEEVGGDSLRHEVDMVTGELRDRPPEPPKTG